MRSRPNLPSSAPLPAIVGSLARAGAFVVALTAACVVHAQPLQLAGCSELAERAVQPMAQHCNGHAACRWVLQQQRSCGEARTFVDRLCEVTAARSVAAAKDLTADDVFEAQLPPASRAIEADPQVKAMAQRIRAAVQGSVRMPSRELRFASGARALHVGEADRSGRPRGAGFLFDDSGNSFRGTFEAASEREAIGTNGARRVGEFVAGKSWHGRVAYIDDSGFILNGRYENGAFVEGVAQHPDGSREVGRFSRDAEGTTRLVQGERFGRDGTLREKGRFAGDKLVEGERFDGAGNVVSRVP